MKGSRWGIEETAEILLKCAQFEEEEEEEDAAGWRGVSEHPEDEGRRRSFDLLGVGLEHRGRNIRRLDYAREIFGGNWPKNSAGT